MIVDTSAIVAVIWDEAEGRSVIEAIVGADSARISAATYLEAGIVLDRESKDRTEAELDLLLAEMGISIVPVSETQARLARQAYRDFGKGSGHKAQLNFGDCFAYALASESGEGLLYKGDDFAEAGLERLA